MIKIVFSSGAIRLLFSRAVIFICLLLALNSQAQYTKLLDFSGTANGTNPYGSLISDGTFLYGMTQSGGANNLGTIFKVKPDGTGYAKLLDFAGAANGRIPYGSLFYDGTFLYGLTAGGGTSDFGVLFKIKPDGTGYVKLLNFTGVANGSGPEGALISDGTFLYGTTFAGGTNDDGTIFKIKPDGTGYVKLLDLANTTTGREPNSLIYDGTFLYGLAEQGGANFMGAVFKIKTDGTGFTRLLDFAGTSNGSSPYGDLITDGTFLYGMTSTGGTNNFGTVFKIKTDGTGYVKLLDFAGSANGKGPHGSLISDGTFLYGMTEQGGTSNFGLIFKIKTDGTGYTKLLDFTGIANGSNPYSSLFSDGTFLYGTTVAGGANDLGTVFKYKVAAVPAITSFSPASGPVGTSVTITGTNFSSTPANNIVYFGATKAAVTAATSTQLTVTVPFGATYQPISVLVNGLTAYSEFPFTVTFTGGGTIDNCSFAPKVDFTTGTTPGGIVIADLDGDGKSDMALVSLNNNTISTYLNTSTVGAITSSSFAPKVDFVTTASPTDLAVGDMDGDGRLDLVSVNTANTVSVFLNTSTPGTISLAAKVDFTIVGVGGGADRRVAVGDLDGDGKPEIAVPNGFTLVSVLQNQSTPGNIAFAAKVDFTIAPPFSNPLSIVIADVDGDAKPELAAIQGNTISVLRNICTVGTIDATSFAPYVGFLAGTGARDLAIGDLDGDLKPDFVTANRIGNSISVFRNTSTTGVIDATSFAPKVDFPLGSSGSVSPHGVTISDINGDGKPDIAVARSSSSFLSVFENKTSSGVIDANSFSNPAALFSTGPFQIITYRIASGDLDGDGTPDLAMCFDKISVFRNTNVTLPPTITSFSPTSGPVGSTVTITGTNFSTIPTRNTVKFNGVFAAVTASTSTQLTVTVPFDATPGPITVIVGCNSANTVTSSGIFTVNGQCVTSTQRNALNNFYNDTNGSSWNNHANWLSADISTWFGVTVTGCFVTGIDLGENNLNGQLPYQLKDLTELTNLYLKENELTGDVPAEIGMLSKLQTLDLSVNHFSGLPNFSTSSLNQANLSFQVYGNDLDFADLEPNVVFSQFGYAPQNDIPPGDIISFIPGQTLDISFSTPGTANSYQWFNNSVAVGSPSSVGDYSKPNAVVGDVGQYVVEITNSIVPGLTLKSVPYTVVADPCASSTRTAGFLDLAFDPLIDYQTAITAVGIQSTGQIIVSTGPTSIGGTGYDGIVRYNPDGSLDNTFVANDSHSGKRQMVIQSNDKIITSYSPYGGYSDILRLNADGSPDASFSGVGSDYINGLALQSDDYIIVSFSSNSGYTLDDNLVRLDADGDLDNSFTNAGLLAKVIKVQPDGYILAGGYFPGGITRLTPTGTVDSGFTGYLDGEVTDIAVQSDGKIIAVGTFNDPSMRGIVRLNTDGSVDPTFNALGISSIPYGTYPTKILIHSDGQIVIGGFFDAVNGTTRPNLVRLNTNGTPDCPFDPGLSSDDAIVDMVFDDTENIFIVGPFTFYDGITRNGLALIKTNVTTSCLPSTQKAALVALYNSTNGANWTVNTNWLSGDESNWFGVTVVGCNVTKVELPNNNLTGSLPPEIGDLTGLIELKLSFNHLSGNLPSSITALSNLEVLRVDNNQTLSGPLPSTIGNMSSLRDINTQGNAFTGAIPASLASCAALEYLQLEANQHTGSVPVFLGSLSNLKSINLGFNQFTGTIPTQLGNLSNLNYLSLAENDLTGTIPVELGSPSLLDLLDLSRNQLSGTIPKELGNLSILTSLQLWRNQLTGTIPTEIGNIITLQELSLADNQLTGSIPVSFGNLVNMRRLALWQNQLTGPVPKEFGNMVPLIDLSIYGNQLSGPLPIELGNLINLESFDIFTNQLSGSLPKELAQCTKLTAFEASDNQFSGTLPKEYASLTDLTVFAVSINQLTGAVPVEYLAWTNIQLLYLQNNQFDAIPTFPAGIITDFEVQNNLLEFGDLESNVGITGYVYAPQATLPGGTFTLNAGTALTIPFVTSGTANQYQWFKNGVLIPGATSSTFSIPSTTVNDAGDYTVNVTNSIVTGLTLTSLPFTVTIIPVILISPQPADFVACVGDIATFTTSANGATNITYQWQYSPDGVVPFADITNGGGYSNAMTATLSVDTQGNFGSGRYRCRINGDLAVEVITNDEGLFINALPSAPGTTGTATCSGTIATVSASGGVNGQYRWYTVSSGGTAVAGQVNDTYVTPALSAPTTYYVSINNGTCESLRTSVDVTIIPLPSAPATTGASACGPTASLILMASGGVDGQYRWYSVPTGGTSINGEVNSVYTTPTLSLTSVYYVSINDGTCESLRTPVTATIQVCNPPTIVPTVATGFIDGIVTIDLTNLVSDLDNNLDPSTLKITAQPASGAIASLSGFILTIDYSGVPFTATETISLQVCDFTSLCTTQQISIEFATDIGVYNAVSPNGDGKNEFLFLQYIEVIPETQKNNVGIFNRWGDEVFSINDYNNKDRVFAGYSNSGSKLPVGTYFYKISFASGAKARTGFLVLKY